jgi:hypothetical protein
MSNLSHEVYNLMNWLACVLNLCCISLNGVILGPLADWSVLH